MVEREPIFNVPGIVLVMIAIFIAVHLLQLFLGPDEGLWMVIAGAFIPARYDGMTGDIPGGMAAAYTSFISHIFVHADVAHLAMNSAWFLAFGSVLARRLGSVRFVIFTLACGVAGAVAFLVAHPGLPVPVVGASGAVSGLMAAALRILFPAIDARQGYLLRENPAAIRAMSLRQSLTDRRMVLATLAFVMINLLAIFGFGAPSSAGGIAWEAHLGGYAFALLTFGAFDIAAQNQPVPQIEAD